MFWEDAGPIIIPFLAAFFIPRLPTWALPCAVALGGACFVLSLQASSQAVAVLGAASNAALIAFAIFDVALRFIRQSKEKRRLFE